MRKKFLYILCICFFASLPILAQQAPATEVRAVWLTTNWRLDWPKENRNTEQQKQDLKEILNELQKLNFNTVFFQARAKGRSFYNSSIEQKSTYIPSKEFDPLAFAIEECHKRGMECHAWLITYPMGGVARTKKGNKKVSAKKPAHYKLAKGQWYLDPSSPQTKKLLLALVGEIVTNYDVDGIHFDYIRYPDNKFKDDAEYKLHGKGKTLADWRRNNITQTVIQIYDKVKSIKNWVQVSSSPLGRYKTIDEVNPNDGWTAYNGVFQDAAYWLEIGKHDALYPMLYYKDKYFYPFLTQWAENKHDKIVVPGIGIYQMLSNESNWELLVVTEQMHRTRKDSIGGQAFFRAGIIMDNLKGVKDSIQNFYKDPAKLPPLTWLSKEKPEPPINLEVYKDSIGDLQIKWQAPNKRTDLTYTVYVSSTDSIDTNNAKNILGTGLRGSSYSFSPAVGEFGCYYSVSAIDRYHNESEVCFAAYFSHSENEQ